MLNFYGGSAPLSNIPFPKCTPAPPDFYNRELSLVGFPAKKGVCQNWENKRILL